MDEKLNENFQEEDNPRIPSTWILIGIGILLLVAAVLLYPDAKQRMEQERALGTTLTEVPTLPAVVSIPTQTPQPANQPGQIDPDIYTYPSQFGILILSVQEGTDSHLFAYQPFLEKFSDSGFSGLPLTRLTSGSQKDITPDISPDGRYIAFSSNRGGPWDIYILDLLNGEVEQFTDTLAYDANPSWSPDGEWLAYESYQLDNLEILLEDRKHTTGPIPLTRNPAADYAPDWSEQGRWISFISSRSGQLETWYANLDSPEEDKAVRIPNLTGRSAQHPTWSADGRYLTWSITTSEGNHSLITWDSQHPDQDPVFTGSGDWPLWAAGAEILYAVVEEPSGTYLTAYPGVKGGGGVMLPPVALPGHVEGISWAGTTSFTWLSELNQGPDPTPLWLPVNHTEDSSSTGQKELISLRDLSAPYPQFLDDAAGNFSDLRNAVSREAGWDFLSTLENAYVPLGQPLPPGVNLDWLYTGRGMILNDTPRLADWLVLVRNDYGTRTYWTVYLRANDQQGNQGRPLQHLIWDLDARYSGSNAAYENGGAYSPAIPPGYWVNFSALAEAYGWRHFPAERYWQYPYAASRYGYFAFSAGLSLEQALLELYIPQQLEGFKESASP
jgi:TolB protein